MKAFCKTGLNIVIIGMLLGGLSACGQKTSEEYIQEAKQFTVENNTNAAILSLKNAIQIEPKSAIARFELGQLYLQQKQFESAEKELNRALEYGYDASKVIPMLTQAYHQTGAYSAISKIEHGNAGLTPVERAEIGYFKVTVGRPSREVEDALPLLPVL